MKRKSSEVEKESDDDDVGVKSSRKRSTRLIINSDEEDDVQRVYTYSYFHGILNLEERCLRNRIVFCTYLSNIYISE